MIGTGTKLTKFIITVVTVIFFILHEKSIALDNTFEYTDEVNSNENNNHHNDNYISSSSSNYYDVVVYDATSGGVMAAVSSGRKGLKTVLLCASWPSCFDEGGRRIGGMSTSGLGRTDLGEAYLHIGGLAYEFYQRNRRYYNDDISRLNKTREFVIKKNQEYCRLPAPDCDITYNLEPNVAEKIFHEMLGDAGVIIMYESQVVGVRKKQRDATSIESILLGNGNEIEGNIFIDASYEGDLMAMANVSYAIGRESRDTYGESLAGISNGNSKNQFSVRINPFDKRTGAPLPFVTSPSSDVAIDMIGKGDHRIQAYNFRLCVTNNAEKMLPFPRPIDYDAMKWKLLERYLNACNVEGTQCQIGFPSCNTREVPNKKFDMNNCGGFSTDFIGGSQKYPEASYEDRKKIWYEHLNYQQGLIYFMANDKSVPIHMRLAMKDWGLCADEFENNKIAPHWPSMLYVREARRMVGSKVFTQHTPKEQKFKSSNSSDVEDVSSIGIGGFQFDSHNTQRIACKNASVCFGTGPGTENDTRSFVWDEGDVQIHTDMYQIPYWVLLPKLEEATNLLIVGTPSTSHIGLSTLRLEPQFMTLGHAAGTAAYIASKQKKAPQNISFHVLRYLLQKENATLDI